MDCNIKCPIEEKLDQTDKGLAILETKLSVLIETTSKMCDKTDRTYETVITHNNELKHTTNDIGYLRDCISEIKKDIVSLKIISAKYGAIYGGICAIITAVATSCIIKYLF